MNYYIYFLLSMVGACFITTKFSNKHRWKEKLWNFLQTKIETKQSVICAIVATGGVQVLLNTFMNFIGIHSFIKAIILGSALGFCATFVPDFDTAVKTTGK